MTLNDDTCWFGLYATMKFRTVEVTFGRSYTGIKRFWI